MKRIVITAALLILITSCGIHPQSNQLELSGTNWRLISYANNIPLSGKDMTAKFTAKEVQGSASCNHYFGAYKISGNKLSIDGLGWTEMACMDPEGIMEQEQTVMGLLSKASEVSIEGNQLLIRTSSGDLLVFDRIVE